MEWPPEPVATHCEPLGLVQVAETVAVTIETSRVERHDSGGRRPLRTDRPVAVEQSETQWRRCSKRIGTYFGAISGSILGMTLSTTSGNRSGNWLRR
jgi:hypothetical protein